MGILSGGKFEEQPEMIEEVHLNFLDSKSKTSKMKKKGTKTAIAKTRQGRKRKNN